MDSRKRKSKDQESKVAKELVGRVTPASGALWGAKADVRNDVFLVECKTTEKDFYQLSFNVWDKIYREAIKDGLRVPVMCIDLNGGKERVAVMKTHDLGNYPPAYSLKTALDISNGKTTFRIRYTPKGVRFYIENSKHNTGYDLQSIPWSEFLDTVVKSYEI